MDGEKGELASVVEHCRGKRGRCGVERVRRGVDQSRNGWRDEQRGELVTSMRAEVEVE